MLTAQAATAQMTEVFAICLPYSKVLAYLAFTVYSLRNVGHVEIFIPELGDMIFSALEIVAQQQVEHLRHALRVLGHYLDETAALRVHGGHPHHLRVVFAESPLYEITAGGKTWFAYSEKEKADILGQISSKKPLIQRSKGLGENDPEMMWMTTMNPETRRLIRVMPTEAAATAQVFDLLLGENAQGRKEHIAVNGYKYLDLADIS